MVLIKAFTDLQSVWYSYALSICGDKDLANDLVQDFYIKMLSLGDLDNYMRNGKPNRSFVHKVLLNMFIDMKRKEVVTVDITSVPVAFEPNDISERLELEADMGVVLDIIKKLNKKEDSRHNVKYLMAYVFSGKSLRGLAKEVGTSLSIVNNAVNNGKREIREEYLKSSRNNNPNK